MFLFSTEFPVKPYSRAEFIALVRGWLMGTDYSNLFEGAADAQIETENATLSSANGEVLKIQELVQGNRSKALGFRYDNPDAQGRLWRTELVLLGNPSLADEAILRVRTQCLAGTPTAKIEEPKKPHIIKTIIQDNRTREDGYFVVSDQPHFLTNSDDDLNRAEEIINGAASIHLPVVYISCDGNRYAFSEQKIKKLAFELCGIAHVVVEPSSGFSHSLKDRVDGINAYGGSVGVYSPEAPRGKKFYVGGAIHDANELFTWVRDYCSSLRSRHPAKGWDWTELQEQAFRQQRERERSRLSQEETEELYNREIESLRDQIEELKQRSSISANDPSADRTDLSTWNQDAFSMKVVELYDGEVSDRMQLLVKTALKYSENAGLDKRTAAVAQSLLRQNSPSNGLKDFRQDLTIATKDPSKYVRKLKQLLGRHGFIDKSNNKHPRLEPKPSIEGVDNITLVNTPSDRRSLLNQKSQIENNLGLSVLG
ncbi:MAG: hypothetical protein ACRBBT_04510 [Paracoccaceae bacterium]